jgi:hypothetical protein
MRDPHDEHDASEGGDDIERMRALWSALDAPAPDDSDAVHGAARDLRADEAVRRLRAAWVRLEAPRAELPWRLRRRSTAAALVGLAAAAALLAGVALGLMRRDEPTTSEPIADVGDEAANEAAESAPNDTASEATPNLTGNAPRAEVDASGRLVLHSGSVRLMWVEPTPAAPTSNTQP